MDAVKRKERTCRKDILQITDNGKMTYLSFPALTEISCIRHLFTTRVGGMSRGHLGGLNLSYTRGDKKENVDENFRLVAQALGVKIEDFVFTDQTHTANVRVVTGADRGKGIVKPRDYKDIDGLVTKEKGIVLSAFFADCVPLYFVDPVKEVIGLCHSGWKGTVGKIGKKVVETMEGEFGCVPEDLIAAIAPSVCRDCYEVSLDVAEQFMTAFSLSVPLFKADVSESESGGHPILRDKGNENTCWIYGNPTGRL